MLADRVRIGNVTKKELILYNYGVGHEIWNPRPKIAVGGTLIESTKEINYLRGYIYTPSSTFGDSGFSTFFVDFDKYKTIKILWETDTAYRRLLAVADTEDASGYDLVFRDEALASYHEVPITGGIIEESLDITNILGQHYIHVMYFPNSGYGSVEATCKIYKIWLE